MKRTKEKKDRRRDHFVPEAYLKGFTNHEHKFYVWNKATNKPIDYTYPAQHCWLDHYYQIIPGDLRTNLSQIDPDFVEHYAFKVYEDTIQDIVRMFQLQPDFIPIRIFLMLCQGYILQKIRTPAYEKGIKKIHAERGETLIKGSIDKTRTKIRRDDPRFALIKDKPEFEYYFTDEFWSKMVEEYKARPIDTRSTQHQSIIDTYTNMGETANYSLGRLSMMHITIYNAPNDAYFLTSDSPGFSLIADPPNPVLKAVDFRFHDMLAVLLPISSKQAMFLHFYGDPVTALEDRPINHYQATLEDVYNINRDTFYNADEKIFCVNKEYLQSFLIQVSTFPQSV